MIPRQCAKCGSDKIIPGVRVRTRGSDNSRNDLELEVPGRPNALLFKSNEYGRVSATVCGACGFTEFRTSNAPLLWESYQAGLKR